MSIQTEAMRELAGNNRLIDAGQKADHSDALWYGYEMVNHPTPSDCERWLMTYSSKIGYTTKNEAITKFKELLKS